MKKLLVIMMCALGLSAFVTGCDKDKPEEIAYKAGYATGLAVNLTIKDEAQKEAIVMIMDKLAESKNFVDESAESVVSKITTEVVQKLVDEGKLDEKKSLIVIKISKAVGKGIDFLFKKHPDWKEKTDLIVTVVGSFGEGVMDVIGSDELLSAPKKDYDVELYNYLKDNLD